MPHSEIPGSKPVDGSPELIAVFRVLHSLLMPRHPSCARIRLAIWCSSPAFAPFGPDGPRSLAAGTQSPFLPYEKFLALWRGSLPADLVYELQFSFNFQLPVFKDQDDPERGRSRKQQTFALRILMHLRLTGVSPSLPEGRCLLRKEVIQPLVPQRLPCYDSMPITTHTVGGQMPDFGCRRLS